MILQQPLLSHQAVGKFGKTVIFDYWKDKKVVRRKVDPSNPRTPAQKGFRSLFYEAKSFFHATPWTEKDTIAHKLLSRMVKRPMGHYAAFMSSYLMQRHIWPNVPIFHHGTSRILGNSNVRIHVRTSSGIPVRVMYCLSAKLYGQTKHMPEIGATGHYVCTIPQVKTERLYFWFFDSTPWPPYIRGVTGVYTQGVPLS